MRHFFMFTKSLVLSETLFSYHFCSFHEMSKLCYSDKNILIREYSHEEKTVKKLKYHIANFERFKILIFVVYSIFTQRSGSTK